MENILVIGASGFVGYNLCSALKKEGYPVSGTFHSRENLPPGIKPIKLDILDKESVSSIFKKEPPAKIVHLAYSKNQDMEKVIVEGTRNLVSESSKLRIPVFYFSTDLVFNGQQGNYSEDAEPDPIIDYGRFKLQGEKIVSESGSWIIRTSLVYDSRSMEKMNEFTITSLRSNQETTLFTDEYRTPVDVKDLVKGVIALLKSMPKEKTWHIAGPQVISRYDYGILLAKHFRLNEKLIKPVSIKDCKTTRPPDTSLNIHRFSERFFLPRSPFFLKQ